MIKAHYLIALFILWAAVLARAEVVSVDVYEWARTGTGMTPSGWTVTNIDEYVSEKGVRFDKESDFALSPEYSGIVTQLVMTIKPSSETTTRFLTVVPVISNDGVTNLVAKATKSYVEQTFLWCFDDGVRRFRLQNATGKGNVGWGIRTLSVYLDRIEAPQDLREESAYSDALSVAWTPDPRAVSNEVELDGITTVQPEFDLLERWDFSVLTNSLGNPASFEKAQGAEQLTGVSGEYLNVQANSGGYLQAGNTKGAGKIGISLTSRGRRTALMRLYRHDNSDGTDGPIAVSSVDLGGVTNVLAEPFLTTQPHDFVAELSEDTCELLITTDTKSRRIRVEDVKIVTDYVPGYATTNAIAHCRTARTTRTFKGLVPGDFIWRVKSFDGKGVDSVWSSYQAVTLSEDDPMRPVPGFSVICQ